MDFKKVFISIIISTVCIIGLFTWIAQWNISYNDDVGISFINTIRSAEIITNITNIEQDVSENIETPAGQGVIDATFDLAKRALSIITILPRIIGVYDSLITDIGIALDIPPQIINFGIVIFIVSFGITIAYLLLTGAKNL